MPLKVKVAGAWVDPKSVHVKVSGVWQPVKQIYTKVAGVWQLVWNAAPTITNIWNGLSINGYSFQQQVEPSIYINFNKSGILSFLESPHFENIDVGNYASSSLQNSQFEIMVNWAVTPSVQLITAGFTPNGVYVDMLPSAGDEEYQIYVETMNSGYGTGASGQISVSIRNKSNPSSVVSGTITVGFFKEW